MQERHGLRRRTAFVVAIAAWLGLFAAPPVVAQTAPTTADCDITTAANAAMQRQIALLDAAKVNPSEFFNGANSCLTSSLLNSLDLSNLIPSMFNVSSLANTLINSVINAAKQKVCEVINEQLQKVVGNLNLTSLSFESIIGAKVNELLGVQGTTSTLTIPNIEGIGQYQQVTNGKPTSQEIPENWGGKNWEKQNGQNGNNGDGKSGRGWGGRDVDGVDRTGNNGRGGNGDNGRNNNNNPWGDLFGRRD